MTGSHNPPEWNRSSSKQLWQQLRLTYVGDVVSLIRSGEGKLTPPAVDPGEPRKTRPSG